MSAHDADLTLKQIVEVCDKAVELRNSMTWEEFRGDWRKQMLGERLVEILGEAVKRLPDDLRQRHPQLPWDKIAGTRDYIAHGYDMDDLALQFDGTNAGKPDANHANAHPSNDWSCQICNQHRATSPARGSGFKSDTHQDNARVKGRRRLSRRSGAEADEPPVANSPNGQRRFRRKRLAVVGFLVASQHF